MSARKRNGSTPEYNVVLLGALGVGKSALTVKYITKRFIMEYDPDIEDVYTKSESLDNQEMIVHVMDTCDKEESDPLRYLKWADAFLVVYSVTNRLSFDIAKEYLDIVTQHLKGNPRDSPLALLGNKIDLERYRQVSHVEGGDLAAEFDCLFFEATAAEEYEYVESVFFGLIHEIQRDKSIPLPPLYISEEKGPGFPVQKRPKSPKSTADRIIRDDKDAKGGQKKTTTSFKLFNKSFKIFN